MLQKNKIGQRIFVVLVLLLFFNIPLVQAVQISNVRAEEVTDTSAVIAWETDEPANSFVNYGTEINSLHRVGDAVSLPQHRLPLSGLTPETAYVYSVESSDVFDDNGGSLYTFTTSSPDTTVPELFVELPEIVQQAHVDISGKTEAKATVKLSVNSVISWSASADTEGTFTFSHIALVANAINFIHVEASDAAGNIAAFDGVVFSDTLAPKIVLEELPALVTERTVQLNGTMSENATVEFLVNGRSAGKTGEVLVQTFSQEVVLDEGVNTIKVVAKDRVGWEATEERTLSADTVPPQVKFDLTGGTEYFEGFAAETDIVGETEAGAMVYLYIYHVQADQFRPDFGRAIEKTFADEQGKFTFSDVDFPPPPFSSLEQFAPREVPQGLQDILIAGQGELAQQRKAYRLYVIVEDRSGKTNFAEKTVNVNSCSAGEYAFDIQSVQGLELPFRLNPSLMEQGMQDISAVFNLTYIGGALESVSSQGAVEQPFRVQQVQFQKACTQKMIDAGFEDLDLLGVSLGCKLLPSMGLKQSPNADKTAFFVTQRLQRAADFLKREENLWDDLKKRQIRFPLKVVVQYQEREPSGGWSATKTQTMCYDMGYAIDVPIESDEFLPDELAKDLVTGLNETITVLTSFESVIQEIMPYVGGSCVVSWIVKLGAKYVRIFQSNFESLTSPLVAAAGAVSGDKKEQVCPDAVGQQQLYLKSTLEAWRTTGMGDRDAKIQAILAKDPKEVTLDERCPSTAGAWEAEAFVDKLYKLTCDRFLCRTVPAGWTETAPQQEIDRVEQEQTQCVASGTCAPLTPIEQCEKHLQRVSTQNIDFIKRQTGIAEEGSFPCYMDGKGIYYYVKQSDQPETGKGIWKLTPVVDIAGRIGEIPEAGKFAYKPEGSQTFCVGIDATCEKYCERKPGYTATDDGFYPTGGGSFTSDVKKSCYAEEGEEGAINYKGSGSATLNDGKYRAGYTKDCFIAAGERYQCVCKPKDGPKKDVTRGARTAVDPKEGQQLEEWDYHQEKTYLESQSTAGTLYPKWRYYDGRDFTAAFGFNSFTDILFGSPGHYSNTKISPNDYVGSFQTMCLTKINAHVQTLKAILTGLQACIVEAENNGLYDAGTCKTLFSQAVCGLIYKGIAYLASSCSPLSAKDLREEILGGSDEDVAAFFSAGFQSIPQAMQASIDEVNADYGNAKLKEFFSAGAQGFAEKICLAAFGFDFPTLSEFVQDVAYATSTKVDVMFITANRELVTFDPSKGKSVHNYELGGFVLPGCKLRGYTTELKCIGPEDQGNPGVDLSCGGKGCDCLSATELRPEVAGERTYRVASGSKFGDIQKGGLLDLPIQSPERVASNFRYDHLVFTAHLDKFEDPEQCFESQYGKGNIGVFYFPIRDITPPGILACEVHTASGRFICPQITSLFGGGQNYFEAPYLQCVHPRTGEAVDCKDTPNLYLANDPIVIKPYLTLGEQATCLKISDSRGLIGGTDGLRIPLPENAPGPRAPQIPLGTVTEAMLKGSGDATIIKMPGKSDPGCGGHGIGAGSGVEVLARPESGVGGGATLEFVFGPQISTGANTYTVAVKAGSSGTSGMGIDTSRSPNYAIDTSGMLAFNGNAQLTADQINQAIFTFNGFTFTKVFGSPTRTEQQPPNFVCSYQTISGSSTTASKVSSLQIRAELLLPGANEDCFTAKTLVPRSNFGQPFAETTIRLQTERTEEAVVADIHTDFINNNYPAVEQKAKTVIQQKANSQEHALARYYLVAVAVLQENEGAVLAELDAFFRPELQLGTDYTPEIKETEEYKKIEKYLCEVEKVYDVKDEINTVGKCTS